MVGDLENLRGMSLRRVAAVLTAQLLHIGMQDQISFNVKCLDFQLLATDSNILKYGKRHFLMEGGKSHLRSHSVTSTLAENNDNSKVLEKSTLYLANRTHLRTSFDLPPSSLHLLCVFLTNKYNSK